MTQEELFKKLVAHCKEYGFVFPSSEIYDGLGAVYDYGQNGVELKNNLKAAWWRAMVYERDDVEGLDAAILTNQKVLHYSGHEDTFSDPMTDCRKCKGRFRADHIKDGKCPNCGSTDLTEPRPFNRFHRKTKTYFCRPAKFSFKSSARLIFFLLTFF